MESMGIRYVFEHIFMDLCKFFGFRYFFDPETKSFTKNLLPDERRDVAKMLMNFWFEVEKISKNEKLPKIHENLFEHIPNACALQFWAPNTLTCRFGHGQRAKSSDFG